MSALAASSSLSSPSGPYWENWAKVTWSASWVPWHDPACPESCLGLVGPATTQQIHVRLPGRDERVYVLCSGSVVNTQRQPCAGARRRGGLPLHRRSSRTPWTSLRWAAEGRLPSRVWPSCTAESPARRPLCPVFSSSAVPGPRATGSPCPRLRRARPGEALGANSRAPRGRPRTGSALPRSAAARLRAEPFPPPPGPRGTCPELISSPERAGGSGGDGVPLAVCGTCTVSPEPRPWSSWPRRWPPCRSFCF